MLEDFVDLISRKNYGKTCRFARAFHRIQPTDFLFEHLLVKKEQRAQRLILSRGSDVAIASQGGQKSCYLRFSHLGGVTFAVEKNVSPDPIDVGLLGSDAVMLQANDVADEIEQFG